MFTKKQYKLNELEIFEEHFKEVRTILAELNRDDSRTGRINEFTGTVFNQLYLFTEFVDNVINEGEINLDTMDHFEGILSTALKEFQKLKNILDTKKC